MRLQYPPPSKLTVGVSMDIPYSFTHRDGQLTDNDGSITKIYANFIYY